MTELTLHSLGPAIASLRAVDNYGQSSSSVDKDETVIIDSYPVKARHEALQLVSIDKEELKLQADDATCAVDVCRSVPSSRDKWTGFPLTVLRVSSLAIERKDQGQRTIFLPRVTVSPVFV